MQRLPYEPYESLPPPVREIYDELVKGRGYVTGPSRALLHSPATCRAWTQLAAAIRRGKLDPQWAELAILTTANWAGFRYAWVYHTAWARKAGLSQSEIDAVANGSAPAGFSPDHALVYRVVRTLLDGKGELPQELFDQLAKRAEPEVIVDLVSLVGLYQAFSLIGKAFNIELEEDYEEKLQKF